MAGPDDPRPGAARGSSGPAAPQRKCPICAKPTQPAFKPFCSKRCADIDLNRWLKGVYAIPVAEEDDAPGDPEDTSDR